MHANDWLIISDGNYINCIMIDMQIVLCYLSVFFERPRRTWAVHYLFWISQIFNIFVYVLEQFSITWGMHVYFWTFLISLSTSFWILFVFWKNNKNYDKRKNAFFNDFQSLTAFRMNARCRRCAAKRPRNAKPTLNDFTDENARSEDIIKINRLQFAVLRSNNCLPEYVWAT